MQEALPELEIRCDNPKCGAVVPQTGTGRRKRYCSTFCNQKAIRARESERCANLTRKVCRDCSEDKPIAEFRPPSSLRCRGCMKIRRQDEYLRRGGKEWMYEINLATRYGISVEEYQQRVAAQGGRCAICGDEPGDGKRLHVDHDHETGAIRDILCQPCNLSLGNAKDDPARLLAMVAYLERHRGQQAASDSA